MGSKIILVIIVINLVIWFVNENEWNEINLVVSFSIFFGGDVKSCAARSVGRKLGKSKLLDWVTFRTRPCCFGVVYVCLFLFNLSLLYFLAQEGSWWWVFSFIIKNSVILFFCNCCLSRPFVVDEVCVGNILV